MSGDQPCWVGEVETRAARRVVGSTIFPTSENEKDPTVRLGQKLFPELIGTESILLRRRREASDLTRRGVRLPRLAVRQSTKFDFLNRIGGRQSRNADTTVEIVAL
jgi:hypothetical protein